MLNQSPKVFLYGALTLLYLSPLSPGLTLAEVLGEAVEAVELFAAATDDLARDEEDKTFLSPELTFQVMKRQHHRSRREPLSETSTKFQI